MPVGRALLLLLAAAVIAGTLGPATVAAGAAGPGTALPVSATATPSSGPAPLLVQFVASVTTGTPTSYNWSFGDGAYLNGTSQSDADPSHIYATPGSYTAKVTVWEGSESGSVGIPVRVVASALSVSISARPTFGTAPLTVTFTGSASGGTGTYFGFNWTFGDGAVGSGSTVRSASSNRATTTRPSPSATATVPRRRHGRGSTSPPTAPLRRMV